MSNFNCEKCGKLCIDSPLGCITGCEHYPPEMQRLPANMGKILYDNLWDLYERDDKPSNDKLRGSSGEIMTFNEFFKEYKKDGGSYKVLASEIGISQAVLSRIIHKKQAPSLRMLNRLLAACQGMVSMQELTVEFRPDIYEAVIGRGND